MSAGLQQFVIGGMTGMWFGIFLTLIVQDYWRRADARRDRLEQLEDSVRRAAERDERRK
jgi:hypothetical protein